MIHVPHPFFDPKSMYNRLRTTSNPQDRIKGWFRWLKIRKDSNQESFGECQVVGVDISKATPRKMEVKVTLWSEKARLHCNVETDLYDDALCRVLIIEKEVLTKLMGALGEETATDENILKLFSQEVQGSIANFEISRLFSAIPALDGEITRERGFGVLSIDLGDTEPVLPLPEGTTLMVLVMKKE